MATTLAIAIGTQKAGTTWLADYMRAHPEVHTPPVKEVHYFDARRLPKWCAKYEEQMLEDFKAAAAGLSLEAAADPDMQHRLAAMLLRFRMLTSPADYLRFMQWGAGQKRVLFEATPDYMMIDEAGFASMRALHPDVRLILLMRNPAERFWSSLRFNATHNRDFDIERMFDRLINREDFRLLTDYERTIRAFHSALGPARLHVEFYERLFTPDAMRRICDFVGVSWREPDFATRSNASLEAEFPAALRRRAVDAYFDVYQAIARRFRGDIPENWIEDLEGAPGAPTRPRQATE